MGLHYDSISSKHAPSEIRIYRYDAVSQSFKLDTNAVFYDTVNHYISVRTNNLTLPFIAMIDTMKPWSRWCLWKPTWNPGLKRSGHYVFFFRCRQYF